MSEYPIDELDAAIARIVEDVRANAGEMPVPTPERDADTDGPESGSDPQPPVKDDHLD